MHVQVADLDSMQDPWAYNEQSISLLHVYYMHIYKYLPIDVVTNGFTRIEHVELTERATRAVKEPTHKMPQVRHARARAHTYTHVFYW